MYVVYCNATIQEPDAPDVVYKDSSLLPNSQSPSARKRECIWPIVERKNAARWPSFGHLFWTRFLFFISKLERVSFFPVWVMERLFLSSVSVQLFWPWLHDTQAHSQGKKEQATGSDSALNSAARQLQASCPHTCTHPHKVASACVKDVDAAGYAAFMY